MARPLTKTKPDGVLYERPAEIESALDATFALDTATLRQRLAVRDPCHPDFVAPECLVHLIREARSRGDVATMNLLLPRLLTRCDDNLSRSLPKSMRGSAKEDLLSKFAELFARDGTGKNPDQLDFFEIRFNMAFEKFRFDFVKSERRRARHFVSVGNVAETSQGHDALLQCIGGVQEATQDATHDQRKLLEAIGELPLEEREAIRLVYLLEFEIESADPETETAASLCGVTGRTIHNRLKKALGKLSDALQGKKI